MTGPMSAVGASAMVRGQPASRSSVHQPDGLRSELQADQGEFADDLPLHDLLGRGDRRRLDDPADADLDQARLQRLPSGPIGVDQQHGGGAQRGPRRLRSRGALGGQQDALLT